MTEKIDNTKVGLTQQQIEQIQQLIKLLPQHLSQSTVPPSTSEADMEHNFAGMIMCTHAKITEHSWIPDSGAVDHMTYADDVLSDKRPLHN